MCNSSTTCERKEWCRHSPLSHLMTDDVICPVGRFPNGHYFPFLFTLHAHHSPVASSSHLLFLPLPPPAFVPLVNVRDQHQSVIRLLFLSPAHELHTSRGCTPPPHPFDLLQPKEGERARSIQAPGHVKSPQMMSVDGCAFCLPSFAPSLDRLVTVSLLQHVFFYYFKRWEPAITWKAIFF